MYLQRFSRWMHLEILMEGGGGYLVFCYSFIHKATTIEEFLLIQTTAQIIKHSINYFDIKNSNYIWVRKNINRRQTRQFLTHTVYVYRNFWCPDYIPRLARLPFMKSLLLSAVTDAKVMMTERFPSLSKEESLDLFVKHPPPSLSVVL